MELSDRLPLHDDDLGPDLTCVVLEYVVFQFLSYFLVTFDQFSPLFLAHEEATAASVARVDEPRALIECAFKGADNAVILVADHVSPLLVDFVPYYYRALIDERDVVELVQLIYQDRVLPLEPWL